MLQKENQWFVLHFGINHFVHKNLTIYFLSRSIFIIVSGQKRGSKPVRFSSSPHHTSEGREDIFFCAFKTGHEKSPETAWFRAFSVRYLFWSHNVVRVAIQNFLKNPVISMVFGHPNRKISCISPHIRATVLRQPPFFTPKI